MAITSPIPIGRTPDDYLIQMGNSINNIINKSREMAFKRQQMEEMAKYHGADIALRDKQMQQAHALDSLRAQLLKSQIQSKDPEYQFNQAMKLGTQLGMKPEEIGKMLLMKQLGFKQLNSPYQGVAREAKDLERLKEEFGENSPVYQNAKAQYDAMLGSKKDLADLRARTKAGLKPGEKEFFDEKTGNPLGKEIPLTAKERESEEGNILFNELYPYVYKGAAPFSGEGSIRRLEQAAANYKSDPKARQLFDDFILADKMLGATTVNEASTLKAGRTNRTYAMLKETLDAQDIPKLVKKLIKQYQIPASAQLKASIRYQKALSDARKKARKGTPATQKLYYDPEKQAQHEKEKIESNSIQAKYNDNDLVQVEGPNGIENMTYAEAKKLGAQ